MKVIGILNKRKKEILYNCFWYRVFNDTGTIKVVDVALIMREFLILRQHSKGDIIPKRIGIETDSWTCYPKKEDAIKESERIKKKIKELEAFKIRMANKRI